MKKYNGIVFLFSHISKLKSLISTGLCLDSLPWEFIWIVQCILFYFLSSSENRTPSTFVADTNRHAAINHFYLPVSSLWHMHSQFHLRLVTLLMLIVTSSPQCWLHFIFNIQVVYVHMLLNSQFTKPCIWLEYDLVMFCFIRGKLIFITNSRRYLSVSSLLQILEVPNPTTL